jgi:quercetin dioxygenase-like cupin family protein
MSTQTAHTATLHAWADVPKQEVTAGLQRQFVTAARMTIARLEMKKGCAVASHSHENEQVTLVLSGALKFNVAGKEVIVRSGEMLELPSHVPHGVVEVLEDAQVVDVFSPIRQDWLDGTDSYFKK